MSNPANTPLIVDLDGTLILSDLLYELFLDTIVLGVRVNLATIQALMIGKAAIKRHLARVSDLDYTTLPFDDRVMALVREAKMQGRKVYLASSADAKHVQAIVDHVGMFDGWFASDGVTNLSGSKKAEALAAAFGENKFDYVGNDRADLPVWQRANKAYGVRLSRSVAKQLVALKGEYAAIEGRKTTFKMWLKALRIHQYAKNLLVFVPLFTSHRFAPEPIIATLIAFLAFCACASAAYILNDLLDLKADRVHLSKRSRAFASGLLPIWTGLLTIVGLLFGAGILAMTVSPEFVAVLACYFVLTTSYSVYLKRKMLLDVVVLAMLYTTRIIGGAVAAQVQVSQWLLIFSIFIFMALALLKRYVELSGRLDRGLSGPSNCNYQTGDLSVVASLAAAAGLNAITIFALYVSSPEVGALYSRPKILWLICPILVYWIGRALMMAHRRQMEDDPIVFALKDRVSLIAFACIVIIVLFAI